MTTNKLKKKISEQQRRAELMDYLGIPKTTERPKEVSVYKIWYHNRARLDHTKFPQERSHLMEDSPMFATWEDANRYAKKLEKKDKENMYWGSMTFVPVTEISNELLEKIKKRGW